MIRGPSQAEANLKVADEITATIAGLKANPWILPRRTFAKMRGDNLFKLLAVQHKLIERIAELDSAVIHLVDKLRAEVDAENAQEAEKVKLASVPETAPGRPEPYKGPW